MSWQATSWAERQKTGSAARKALLLILANYADANGRCWPSQETLARGTELSKDTIQRQLKKLIELGLVSVERAPKRRGQWGTWVYQLHLDRDIPAGPHGAARSDVDNAVDSEPQMRPGQAATARSTGPQALRPKPSIEPSVEPSACAREAVRAVDSPKGLGSDGSTKRRSPVANENPSIVQSRLATKLGDGDVEAGWLLLGSLTNEQLDDLTARERAGRLDAAALLRLKLDWPAARPP